MSPSLLLELRAGFDERMSSLGQRFRLDRTGDEWDGILLAIPPADPLQDLGSDLREKATMECRRDNIPELKYGDIITQLRPFWQDFATDPPHWKLTWKQDNPAQFAVKFWMVRIIPQDEANFF